MKRDDRSPEAYLADTPAEQREMLERIRAIVRQVAPGGPEGMRYGMLDFPGVCSLAAQKHHVSLYLPPPLLAAHAADFPGVDRGRSCLRFRRPNQLDEAALRRLLTARVTQSGRD